MDNKVTNHVKRNVKLDYISTFITNLNMQSSIWVLYLAYCGLSLAQIGLVEGIYHATSILFEIPSGALADLLGRKRCMILSRICIAISCMIMLFAKGFWFFALSFVIQALGNNLNSGSEEALIYDSMKYTGQEDQYINVYGKINFIIEVSQGIATVTGGILAEFSYFWCYGACLIIAALAMVPVAFMAEVPLIISSDNDCTKKSYSHSARCSQESIRQMVTFHFKTCFQILKSDIRILKIITYYSAVFAAQTLLFFYSQQYYFEMGYNKIQISLILLITSILSCAGAVASEKLFRRFGEKIAFIGTLAIAMAFVGYGFQNIFLSITVFCIAGFFNSVLYPVQSELLNRLIPSKQRATLISVNSMFFSIAMILLFPLAGMLADKWGLTAVFVGIGVVLLIFTICWNFRDNCKK
ncbi:MAG: MFS transporter [Lachnospiraceae bacterium]|nr:MFS transporter [Lachnospiraceae bacterium]